MQSSRSAYFSQNPGKTEASHARTLQSARGSYVSNNIHRAGRYSVAPGQKSGYDLQSAKLREKKSLFGDNSKKYSVATQGATRLNAAYR